MQCLLKIKNENISLKTKMAAITAENKTLLNTKNLSEKI